jgi:porphobilinogen synthase
VYQVSGEYAMLKAVSAAGVFGYEEALMESLVSMCRGGADLIVTYGALDAARLLASAPPVAEPSKGTER